MGGVPGMWLDSFSGYLGAEWRGSAEQGERFSSGEFSGGVVA